MRISIVEDEAVWRDKIQAAVETYCRDKNISSQINSYSNGKDFMKNTDADLLFLDIELAEGEDGFEIAEQLMNSGNKCKICFLTSHTELARLGYRRSFLNGECGLIIKLCRLCKNYVQRT